MKKFFKAIRKFFCGRNVVVVADYKGQLVVKDRKGRFGFLNADVAEEQKKIGTKLRVIPDGFESLRTFSPGSYKNKDLLANLVCQQPGSRRWLVKTQYGSQAFGVFYACDDIKYEFGAVAVEEISYENVPCYIL